jgi:hypothetical protein
VCIRLSDLMNCISTTILEINIPNLHLPGRNKEIGGHRPQLAPVQSPYRRVRGRDRGGEISSAKPTSRYRSLQSYREIWDTSSLTRERNSFKMGEGLALR